MIYITMSGTSCYDKVQKIPPVLRRCLNTFVCVRAVVCQSQFGQTTTIIRQGSVCSRRNLMGTCQGLTFHKISLCFKDRKTFSYLFRLSIGVGSLDVRPTYKVFLSGPPSFPQEQTKGNTNYRSGTVNSKSFVSKVLFRIKWKFELTVHFKHEMLGK